MKKCDGCLNSRMVVSENGYHSVCCLSQKAALNCILGKKSHHEPSPAGSGCVREVIVEVLAKYTTKVVARGGLEAQEKAKSLVLSGAISPDETNEIILDVRPIET